jgi:hypothetical protein
MRHGYIPLTKGRLPEASREVERVRCPRADLQSAPGRLGYQSPRHYDRGGRCFPGLGQAKAGNARADRVPYVDGPRLARFGAAYGSKRLRSYVRSVVAVAHDRCQDGVPRREFQTGRRPLRKATGTLGVSRVLGSNRSRHLLRLEQASASTAGRQGACR